MLKIFYNNLRISLISSTKNAYPFLRLAKSDILSNAKHVWWCSSNKSQHNPSLTYEEECKIKYKNYAADATVGMLGLFISGISICCCLYILHKKDKIPTKLESCNNDFFEEHVRHVLTNV